MTIGLYDNPIINVEITEAITDNVIECWDKYKSNPTNTIDVTSTATFDGIQSGNALNLSDFQAAQDITKTGTLTLTVYTTLYYTLAYYVSVLLGTARFVRSSVLLANKLPGNI